MRTPDARLNAAERAALADLEAAAAADDPHLAARLRGSPITRVRTWLPGLEPKLRAMWARVLAAGWWGIPVTMAGMALTVLGISAGTALSVAGALIGALGLRILAELGRDRGRRAGSRAGA